MLRRSKNVQGQKREVHCKQLARNWLIKKKKKKKEGKQNTSRQLPQQCHLGSLLTTHNKTRSSVPTEVTRRAQKYDCESKTNAMLLKQPGCPPGSSSRSPPPGHRQPPAPIPSPGDVPPAPPPPARGRSYRVPPPPRSRCEAVTEHGGRRHRDNSARPLREPCVRGERAGAGRAPRLGGAPSVPARGRSCGTPLRARKGEGVGALPQRC